MPFTSADSKFQRQVTVTSSAGTTDTHLRTLSVPDPNVGGITATARTLGIGSDSTLWMADGTNWTLIGSGGGTVVNNYILATKILVLDQVATREKYGDGASVLTGEVARLLGRPIIPSQFLTSDMNASGIYDGTTTTKAGIIQMLRGRHAMFIRRGVTMEVQRDATRGITHMIWKRRLMFKKIGAASEKSAHFAFNMS